MSLNNLVADGKRQMQICNACRYCEGYCAVWRAVERRREFSEHDMAYFANLCHDCRDCYFACPFSTPHEFGINPPKLFSGLRDEVYHKYAWPSGWVKNLGGKRSFWVVGAIAFLVAVILILMVNGTDGLLHRHVGPGAFYKVISELVLEIVFSALGIWLVVGWVVGAMRFWRDIRPAESQRVTGKDVRNAASYALKLRYLGGDEKNEELAGQRRWLHHFVAYGFLLDFVSTALGAFYSHVLHVQAPYPVYHPVVILGVLGGVGIIIGASGLLYVKTKSEDSASDVSSKQSGTAFTWSLLVIAVTGILVLLFRETGAMGIILAVHLGSVASLFLTAPYTKFVHFVYRYLSLVRYAQEERVHMEQ